MRTLYFKLPYFLKFLIINIRGVFTYRKRFSKSFFKRLEFYIHADRIESYYLNKNLLLEEIINNKYYNQDYNSIEAFPVINKQVIKENYNLILTPNFVNGYIQSSGTSGVGLKYPISNEFLSNQWAIFWKFRKIHGLEVGTWCANIVGKPFLEVERKIPPYWVTSYTEKQIFFSSYHLNSDSVLKYISKIIESNVTWMHAYPSVLNDFASLIKLNNLTDLVQMSKLKIITTSSEQLHLFQKENIESVFGCKVRQLYGLSEGVANIFECEHGNLHVDESYSYVEFIPLHDNEYKIIGTGYYNKAFPLIRYDTGDSCTILPNQQNCKCGRKSRIVNQILGRDDDYLLLENGTKIGRLSPIFTKSLLRIKGAQIYQKKAGYADFRIIKDLGYSSQDESKLIQQIIEKLGKDFHYSITYVDFISKTQNGKQKLVISEIYSSIRLEIP